MNAIQFIKEHGVDKARKVIEGAPRNAVYYWQIPRCKHGVYSSLEQNQGRAIVLEELKRLVENVDSIADCDMGDDSHIENHISPNCKVGVK